MRAQLKKQIHEKIITNGNGLWDLNFKEKLLKVQLDETRVVIHAN
jgi:hypothetical protein